jgi:peptide/nickel transport system substrate-binding protein
VFGHLRWQIALAAGGVVLIGAVLLVVSGRGFQDRPARGGQLVEALVGRPVTLNPLLAGQSVEVDLSRLLFSGLTRIDEAGQARPDLAAHWTVSPDGKTYTFTLRADALWHDGTPVTADDVVLTAGLAASPDLPAKTLLAKAWEGAQVVKLDDHTVQVTLPAPHAPFLAAASLGILPAHLLAGVPPRELATHRFSTIEPIGTGPYQLDAPGGLGSSSIRLRRFERHWDAGQRQPYLDTIVLQFFPTAEAALAALGQHSVQAMGGVPPAAFQQLGEESTRFYSAPQNAYAAIFLNAGSVLFGDAALRQALSLALDRAGIVDDPQLVNKQGIIATSPIPPGSWAYDPSVPPPAFDPERARQILDEAGWLDSDGDNVRDREGKSLQFTLATPRDARLEGIARRAQRDWWAIGVTTTLQPLDQQGTVDQLKNRRYEAMLFAFDPLPPLADDPDPFPFWHSSQAQTGFNFVGFSDPKVDQVLYDARQVDPDDVGRRRELYREFQHLFAAAQPALLIYHPLYTYAVVDPNLGGVQLPPLIYRPADRFRGLRSWYTRTERVFRESGG